jgi:hypothetical protein
MISLPNAGVVVLLLALTITAIALASVGGVYSVRGRGARAGAMAALGLAGIVGMVLVLWGRSWAEVFDDVLWPTLIYVGAMAAGLGLAAGLVFALVAAR